jgi:hypothetical protein
MHCESILRSRLQSKPSRQALYICRICCLTRLQFLYVTLIEPPKELVLKHLGIATSADQIGKVEPQAVAIPRTSEVSAVDMVAGDAYTAELLIEGQDATVQSLVKLPENVHPGITLEELCEAEEVVKKDPRCIALAKEVGVEAHQLYADGDGFPPCVGKADSLPRMVDWLRRSLRKSASAAMLAVRALRRAQQSVFPPA